MPILLSSSIVLPAASYAVGLSGISVKSALNQPLDAEIKLLAVQGLSLHDIRASMASAHAFENAGIDQSPALGELKFEVIKGSRGEPVVHVYTNKPVTFPDIEVLVHLSWPNGELYRAYTVLLDPADYTIGIDIPHKNSVQQVTKPTPHKQMITYYGPVMASDDLWSIANRFRDHHTTTNDQAMLAIVNANPHAFIRGNINGLKSGVKLVIPGDDAMHQYTPEAAEKHVAEHIKAWKTHEVIAPEPYAQNTKAAPVKASPEKVSTKPQPSYSENVSLQEMKVIDPAEQTSQASPELPKQDLALSLATAPKDNLETNPLLNTPNPTEQASSEEPISLTKKLSEQVEQDKIIEQENAQLHHDLDVMKEENEHLREDLAQKDNDIQSLQDQLSQIAALVGNTARDFAQTSSRPVTVNKVAAVSAQSRELSESDNNNLAYLLSVLVLLAGGGAFAWFTPFGRKLINEGLDWEALTKKSKENTNTDDTEETAVKEGQEAVAREDHRVATITMPATREHKQETTSQADAEKNNRAVPQVTVYTPEPEIDEDSAETPAATTSIETMRVEPDIIPEAKSETVLEPDVTNQASSPLQVEEEVVEQEPKVSAADDDVSHEIEFESGLGSGLSIGRKGDRQDIEATPEFTDDAADYIPEHFLDEISDNDPISAKLDLAMAHLNKQELEQAKKILDEVIETGNAGQQQEARSLLAIVLKQSDT